MQPKEPLKFLTTGKWILIEIDQSKKKIREKINLIKLLIGDQSKLNGGNANLFKIHYFNY